METLQLVAILLMFGVLTQNANLGVKYPETLICAVRGFSVSILCTYYYPPANQVTQKLWCTSNSEKDYCLNPPYVYDSASNTNSNFVYIGNDTTDCTLLIDNVQFTYSGLYKFRFLTTVLGDRFTGMPGVNLQVADLKVSLIRLSGNGTLKHGDSLNLTCDVNCAQSSSQFVWSKNNIQLQTSGPVLHFPALTLMDSGNYTCTWRTDTTSGSKSVLVQVEGEKNSVQTLWIIAVAAGGAIVFVIIGVVICLRRRKAVAPEVSREKDGEQTQVKQLPQPNVEVQQQEEVAYASVCVKSLNNGCVPANQQKESISTIYSALAIK